MPIQILSAEDVQNRKRQQPQINTQEPTLAPSVPAVSQEPSVASAPQEQAGTLGEQFGAGVEEMKGWGAQFLGMAPGASKETSRTMAAYQQAKQEKANKVKMAVQDFGEVMDSPSKIFQYGAERFARSAPGMVPYAVPGVGAGLGAATSFATTAGRIYGDQEQKDAERALWGATGSAALETLGMGKLLSRPGAGVARDIATGVATESATEGGQQVIENIASGKEDIFEGVGEAMAAGGTIGGGIRTAANIPRMPKAAKETATSIGNIRRKFGGVDLQANPKVNYEIGRAVDMSGELDDINSALVVENDPATRDELIRRRKEINNKAGAASFYKAVDELDQAGVTLTPEALDLEVNEGLSRNSRKIGNGAELAGFSAKDIRSARKARGLARVGAQAKFNTLLPGQSAEATVSNNRKKGREYLAGISGQFNERVNKLTNMITDIDYAQRKTTSPELKAELNDNLFKLRTARKQAEDLAKEMKAETRDRSRIYDAITNQANDLDEFLVSNDIDVGFNPIQLAQKYIVADRALVNQDPSFHEGITDESKDYQDLAMRGATSMFTSGLPELLGLAGRIKDRSLRKKMQKTIEQTRRLAAEDIREGRRAEAEIEPETPTPTPTPEPTSTERAPEDAATASIVAQAQALSPEAQPVVEAEVAPVAEEAPVVAPEPDLGMIPRAAEPVVEEAVVEDSRVAGEDTAGMIPVIEQVKNSMVEVVQSATEGNPSAKEAADSVIDSEMPEAITREEVMDVVDDALAAAEDAAIQDGDTEVVQEIREVRDQVDMLPIPQMIKEAAPEATQDVTTEPETEAPTQRKPDLKMVPGLVKEMREEYVADPVIDEETVTVDDMVEAIIMREPDLGMIPKIKKEIKEEIAKQDAEIKEAEKAAETEAKEEVKRTPDLGMVPDTKAPEKAPVEETVVEEVTVEEPLVEEVVRTPDMQMIPKVKEAVIEIAEPTVTVEQGVEVKAEPDLSMVPQVKKYVEEVKVELEEVTPDVEVTTEAVVEEVIARNPDLGMIPKARKVIKEIVEDKTVSEEKVEVKQEKKEEPKTSRDLVYSQLDDVVSEKDIEQQIEEVIEATEEPAVKEEIAEVEGVEEKVSARDMVPTPREEIVEEVEAEINEEVSDAVEDVIENRNPDLGMIPKKAIKAIDKAQEDVDAATKEASVPTRLGNIQEVKAMKEKQIALTIAKRRQVATNTLVEKGGDVDAEDFNKFLEGLDESSKDADIKRKVGRLAKRHILDAEKVAEEKLAELSKNAQASGAVVSNIAKSQWERLDGIAEEYGVDKATVKAIKDRFSEGASLSATQQASIVKELNSHAAKAQAVQRTEEQWDTFETAADALGVSPEFVKGLREAATSPSKGLKELSKADRNALQKEAERVKKEEADKDAQADAKAEGYDWDLVTKMSKTFKVPTEEVTNKLQKFVDTDGKPRPLTSSEFKSMMSGFEKYQAPTEKAGTTKEDIDARWAELDALAAQSGISEEFVKNLKRKATKAGKGLQDVPSASWDAVIREGKRLDKEAKAAEAKDKAEATAAENTYTYKFAKQAGDAMGIEAKALKDILGRYVDASGKPRDLDAKEFNAFYSKLEAAKKSQDAQALKDKIAAEKDQAAKDSQAEAALIEQQLEAAERDAMAAKVVKKAAQWSTLDKTVKKLGLPKKTLDSLKAAYRNPETNKLEVIPEAKYKSTIEKFYKEYNESLETRRKAVEAKREERLAKAEADAKASVKAEQDKVSTESAKELESLKAQRAEDLVKLKAKLAGKLESRKQQNKLRIEASKRRAAIAKEEADKQVQADKDKAAQAENEAKERRAEIENAHKQEMLKIKASNDVAKETRKARRDAAAKRFAEQAEESRKATAEQKTADLYVAQVQFLKNIGDNLEVENIDDIIDTAFGRIAKPLSDNKLRSLYAQIKGNKKVSAKQESMFDKLTDSTESMKESIKESDSKVKDLETKITSLEKSLKEIPKVDVESVAKEVSETTAKQMLDKFENVLTQGRQDLIESFNKLAKSFMEQGKAAEKAKDVEEASRVVINVKRRMDRRRASGYDKPVEGMKDANGLFTREDVKELQAVMGQGAFTTYMGPMGANFRGEAFGVVRPSAEQPIFNSLEDYKKAVKSQETKADVKSDKGVLDITPKPVKAEVTPKVTTYAKVEEEVVQPVVEKQQKAIEPKKVETKVEKPKAEKPKVEVDEDVSALAAKIAEAQKAVDAKKTTKSKKEVKPKAKPKAKTNLDKELGYDAESLKSEENAKRSPTVQKLLDKYKGDAKTITPLLREVGKTVLASNEELSKKANTLADKEKPIFQIQQGAKALGVKASGDLPSKETLTKSYDDFMTKKTETVEEAQKQELIARSEAALKKLNEAEGSKAILDEIDLSKGDEDVDIAQAEAAEARLAKIANAAKKPVKKDEAKKAAILQRRIDKSEEDGDSEDNLVVVDENNKILGMVKDEEKALAISKKTPKSKVMTLAAALAIGATVSGAASAAGGEPVDEMVDRYKVAGILTKGQADSFTRIGEDMLERSGKSLDSVVDDIEDLLKTFDTSKNKDVPKRKARKARTGLSEKLGQRESSNNYKAENRLGYIGKYQFGNMALQDLGMVKAKPKGVSQKKWLSNPKAWTGRFDINSKKEFLNNPQVQEKVFKKWEEILNKRTTSRGLDKYVGKTIDGVKVTRDGINAASHLLGHGAVQKAFRSGKLNASDANNVTIKEYIELMN